MLLQHLKRAIFLGHVERTEYYGGVLFKYVASKLASFYKVAMVRSNFISVVYFVYNSLCLGLHVSTEDVFALDTFSWQ
jgi:hypothetical protein